MKPSFAEYNSIAADVCQVLAVAEIQYAVLSGTRYDMLRAEACRTLRISIGNAILEFAHNAAAKSSLYELEEVAITKLKKSFQALAKKLAALTTEMKQACDQDDRPVKLTAVLFTEDAHWSVFNIYRLQSNLAIILFQEKDFQPRSRSFGDHKPITNIFMQPCSAIECEQRANIKLSDMIAARVAEFASVQSMHPSKKLAGGAERSLLTSP